MGEMNEKDLEQVTGGAEAIRPFKVTEWNKRNCDVCKRAECSQDAKRAIIVAIQKNWQQVQQWDCPYKR